MLYELVSEYREPMLRHMREVDPKGYGLPRHVDRELEAYLRCGILRHGFTRVRCSTCHDELLVAFSCKHRGLCPSCTARRMADTATHLLDRVLPQARYRQWVFTVPKSLRLRLAREPAWASWVNRLIVRAIAVWQRRGARALGARNAQTGAITFVQQFGGLLNLNVHYHLVVPDGVFVADEATGELSLLRLRGPTDDELLAILDRVADQIGKRLADESGHRDAVDDIDVDPPPDLWSQLQAESATTWRSPPRPSLATTAAATGSRRTAQRGFRRCAAACANASPVARRDGRSGGSRSSPGRPSSRCHRDSAQRSPHARPRAFATSALVIGIVRRVRPAQQANRGREQGDRLPLPSRASVRWSPDRRDRSWRSCGVSRLARGEEAE